MYLIYDIILHMALVALLPYFLVKMVISGKYRRGIPERFGIGLGRKLRGFSVKEVVWFHAVSVGETKAVVPLLKLFKEARPDTKVVFSTVTPTGNAVARAEAGPLIDALIYFPLDLSWVVKRAITLINPSAFVVVEKEVWPNLICALKDRLVPVVVVNGTLSTGSFNSYRRFSFFFKDIFGAISTYCARTGQDAEMAKAVGVNEGNVHVTGNLKFDIPAPGSEDTAEGRSREIRQALSISPEARVIVGGSTHAGEEEALLSAFGTLKAELPGLELRLVIAPRHPERFDSAWQMIKKTGLSGERRSAITPGAGVGAEVILLDTMGELARVYAASTVSFVGGTLVEIGGHNLLEPALFGRPVVYGPHLSSYLYMAELLEGAGASIRTTSARLAEDLKKLITDPALCKKMGSAGSEVIEANRGATEKTLARIEAALR